MKKTLLLCACFVLTLAAAQAATAPVAPTAAPAAKTATTAATPQQNRMKMCAQQYHQKAIAKSQYHAFMSQCLKNPANAATATKSTANAMKPAAAAK